MSLKYDPALEPRLHYPHLDPCRTRSLSKMQYGQTGSAPLITLQLIQTSMSLEYEPALQEKFSALLISSLDPSRTRSLSKMQYG